MQLLTYRAEDGSQRAGVRIDDRIYDAQLFAGVEDSATLLGMLRRWADIEPLLLERLSAGAHERLTPIAEPKLDAPVLYPGAIYCAAANYRDHMHAMAVKLNQPDEPDPRELSLNPYHFVLPGPTCVSGPEEPILWPSSGELIDWEIELVAVIGTAARNVPVERALDYVAAYTIGIDVSVRDGHFIKIPNVPATSVFRNDFIGMKGFEKSCVIGPWLTLARDIPDPQALAMKLWVGDELMQDSSTSEMVFNTAEQISYLSRRTALLPGDLVMTGTPAGTGMERDRFLRHGERVRTWIEGIGEMTQTVA